MLRGVALLVLLVAVWLAAAPGADARVFTPQANWWSSGATCVASRNPPARRWRALPPRTCAGTRAGAGRGDAGIEGARRPLRRIGAAPLLAPLAIAPLPALDLTPWPI
jgi:hypothetical protein